MSELRQNLATREWVIVANERTKRPRDFIEPGRRPTHELPSHDSNCPFCPGNEHETPEDLIRHPRRGPWHLRVFPNRFPALQRGGEPHQSLAGLERRIDGIGYHEVLVESPLHNMTPALQSTEEIHLTLKAFQERGRVIMEDPNVEYVVYFKNHGPAAGTSLIHPHAQLLGLPIIPGDMRRRVELARRAVDEYGACSYCMMMEMELADGRRIVCQNRHFVAFVPYAAPSPFHLWVIPRRHGPNFLDVKGTELAHLADLLRRLFAKLYRGLGDPDYNYIIRSAPFRDIRSDYLHWYVAIVPRVTKAAGFELGSGMYINPSLPEDSAAFLRDTPPECGEPLGTEAAPQ